MKNVRFLFLAILIGSCCVGERISEFNEMEFFIVEDDIGLLSSDTLTPADKGFILFYEGNSVDGCSCSACTEQSYRNAVMDDSTKLYLDKIFVINLDTIHRNTDLFSNINTRSLLNIETLPYPGNRVIDIGPELINSLPEDDLEFTIESVTDDGIQITASRSFFVKH